MAVSWLYIFLFITIAGTAISLFMGLFSMIKGSEFNKKNSNKLMRLRVYLQGLAVIIFGLILWLNK